MTNADHGRGEGGGSRRPIPGAAGIDLDKAGILMAPQQAILLAPDAQSGLSRLPGGQIAQVETLAAGLQFSPRGHAKRDQYKN